MEAMVVIVGLRGWLGDHKATCNAKKLAFVVCLREAGWRFASGVESEYQHPAPEGKKIGPLVVRE